MAYVQQINMVTGDNTLDRMQFAIPAFHAYGHRVPCQVCLFVWCLTARQHWIGQFVPTAGG